MKPQAEHSVFHPSHMALAIQLACENVARGARPYGAAIADGPKLVATGVNRIMETNDPTEHAELNAIRAAARALATPSLTGLVAYASGQPCPMCLAALRLAGISAIYYAYSNDESAPYGFSTADLGRELAKPLDLQSIPIRHVGSESQLENPFTLFAERSRS
ncbi:MAG TPA: nucleoside deaminase [Oligoflexus sp.]|uniref:nucleoside deaminase n=1 Tax=Oligoflexus sp. TaxID=1971216 RepID=UPI002D7EEC49|nr:nucleoside deaminase [Oligoflexus sp.]HET9236635.1 nucleoside deaminase [Oligoflexus sp.]